MEGINVAGFLTAESGLGTAVRNNVFALQEDHIPYALLNIECTSSRKEDLTLAGEICSEAPYDVSLFHVNPDVADVAAQALPQSFWNAPYKIAFWVWEASVVPETWIRLAETFDEVWTPSTYAHTILSRALPVPVRYVPHPIVVTKHERRGAEESATFLCMFDYQSSFERKNPLGAIAAFQAAFTAHEDVRLLIKCINSERHKADHRRLLHAAAEDERIDVLDTYLRSSAVHALMAQATAVVSLHRSEGFGLHLAEAMALHTPVIATNFGGNTDFMNADNSYLIDCALQPLERNIGPYLKGSQWAEPNLDHAAVLLRALYEGQSTQTVKLADTFTVQSVGERIGKHLTRISEKQLSLPRASAVEHSSTPELL